MSTSNDAGGEDDKGSGGDDSLSASAALNGSERQKIEQGEAEPQETAAVLCSADEAGPRTCSSLRDLQHRAAVDGHHQVERLDVDVHEALHAPDARAVHEEVDVARGLVTAEGAKRYGVVLTADGKVDERATEELRRKLGAERGDLKLFDFGGTVDELKARCKADTSLEPPKSPVFQKWMQRGAVQAAE